MNSRKFLASTIGIGALTIVAILNARFELFNIENSASVLFTGLSFIFLPGHILAMVMTNSADPPYLLGIIIGYSIQGLLMLLVFKIIFLEKHRASNNLS